MRTFLKFFLLFLSAVACIDFISANPSLVHPRANKCVECVSTADCLLVD